jgi:serine/threonine-protein kinase ATR
MYLPLIGSRNKFFQLSEPDQCSVVDLLGHISCATDGTLIPEPQLGTLGTATFQCVACRRDNLLRSKLTREDHVAKAMILTTFEALVDRPEFNGLRSPRVVAMNVLRRLTTHSQDANFLDLETSSLGLWCMKCLSSSNRELRISAWYCFVETSHMLNE